MYYIIYIFETIKKLQIISTFQNNTKHLSLIENLDEKIISIKDKSMYKE